MWLDIGRYKAGAETRLTLRQSDILPHSHHQPSVSEMDLTYVSLLNLWLNSRVDWFSLALVRQRVKEKEKLWNWNLFKPPLKKIVPCFISCLCGGVGILYIIYIYICVVCVCVCVCSLLLLFVYMLNGYRVFNLLEEFCITRVAICNSFARVHNPRGEGRMYISNTTTDDTEHKNHPHT